MFNNSGGNNTANGYQSLLSNNTGKNNTALGSGAGYYNTTGDSSVFIGNDAGRYATTSKRLYIANKATSTLIYGEFDTARVGINTTSPKATLDVNGTAKISGLTAGAASDSVVTIDASGNLKKRNASSFGSTSGDATKDTWATVAGVTSSATDVSVNGLKVGRGAGNIASNTALGSSALNSNTSGIQNTAYGYQSLNSNTTGMNNTASGYQSLNSNISGRDNTANGYLSLSSNQSGNSNTANGASSLPVNTTGVCNTANGFATLNSNISGHYNSAIGCQSLNFNTTGLGNTATGYLSLRENLSGNHNTASGYQSLFSNNSGKNNTALGKDAGYSNTTGDSSVFIGNDAGRNATTSKRLYIANKATSTLIYGEFDTARVGINTTSPKATLDVNGTAKISGLTAGAASDSVVTIDASGNLYKRNAASFGSTGGDATADTWATVAGVTSSATDVSVNGLTVGRGGGNIPTNSAFGSYTLNSNTTGSDNTANGFQSLNSNTTGIQNTANGFQSLKTNLTGDYNTANGYQSLYNNFNGYQNTANGYQSIWSNQTGACNTANGTYSLYSNVSGNNNTANGFLSLRSNTSGKNNTALGNNAGYSNTAGDSSVFLGNDAGRNATTSKRLYIANNAASTLIYGEFDTARVGINTTSPTATLDVNGTAKISGLTAGAASDSVVTIDAFGNLKKRNAASFGSTGGDATADTWATVAGVTSSATDVSVNGHTVGRGAGNIASNTALGTSALNSNTTGSDNTANGYGSLASNTTGDNNHCYRVCIS